MMTPEIAPSFQIWIFAKLLASTKPNPYSSQNTEYQRTNSGNNNNSVWSTTWPPQYRPTKHEQLHFKLILHIAKIVRIFCWAFPSPLRSNTCQSADKNVTSVSVWWTRGQLDVVFLSSKLHALDPTQTLLPGYSCLFRSGLNVTKNSQIICY